MNEAFSSPIESDPFTPNADVLWEPIWKLQAPLTPCERDLLNTWSLRRLGFVRTFGAGGLVMPIHHSRLSHVRGVFALAAHFRPHDEVLRLAALLHDVGHGPFSHSSEALPGFDHHEAGRAIILGEEIGSILRKYGFDPGQIIALTEGKPPNPVRTQNGLLHLDHLDFFVRDPFVCGWHTPLPADILPHLYLDGPNVATDLATAEHLIERILFEHQLFTAPLKIATEAVLARLLHLASQKGFFRTDIHSVATLTDADMLFHLAQVDDPEIATLLERLLHRPHTLTVRRAAPEESLLADTLVVRVNQPYLNQPLVDGQPVGQLSERAASMLAEARTLLGTFIVDVSDSVDPNFGP
jgi:HD superfamily phosphohydrolase